MPQRVTRRACTAPVSMPCGVWDAEPVDPAGLVAEWGQIFRRPAAGWDFAELSNVSQDAMPWGFADLVRTALAPAVSALDIGTGGGEFLQQLADVLPPDTAATEGWPPNVPVAAAALKPLGVSVVPYRAGREPVMPFDGGRFDVVFARHEGYNAAEVVRILRPGGVFVTQQVEAQNLYDLRRVLGFQSPYPEQTLSAHVHTATAAGLTVQRAEGWEGSTTFPDVSSLVRFLAMIPWEAPQDFSPERYANVLLELAASGLPLTFTVRRFLLIARRQPDAEATE